MARRAVVILRLVGVSGTRGVTLVLVHHQVVLTAGAFVRSVLAAGAIGLAGHARAVFSICAERRKSRVVLMPISRRKGRPMKVGSLNKRARWNRFFF